RRVIHFLFAAVVLVSCFCAPAALAKPTQEDVFKSIQDNVGESTDPKKLFGFLFGLVAVIIILSLVSSRRKRVVQPKVLNHQGKLLKEVLPSIDLKTAEVKQLKALADDQKLISPLTLLLYPSLLAKSVKE